MFTVRPAAKDDIPAIARLHVQGWKDAYGGQVDRAYLDGLDEGERAAQWQGWFDPAHSPLLIAFSADGAPAGFVSCGRLRTPPPGMSPIRPLYAGEIYALYIPSPHWRQGLGTQLLRAAAQEMAAMKLPSFCLWVLEKNARAVAFYKKTGGERCGKKDVRIGPDTVREICFGWRDSRMFL